MGRYAKPSWAYFLDSKNVDTMHHKQLQSACKKGRLNASGSTAELRARLHAFVKQKQPPAWWVEGMQYHGQGQTKGELEGRVVRLDSQKKVTLTVGQQLEHTSGYVNKMGGTTSAVLVSASPAGCLSFGR